MGIEGIKRWQWILIGLIVGLGLGWVWTANGSGDVDGVSLGQVDFERDLTRTNPKTSEALLRKIVVRPPVVDVYGKTVQPVTFERMQPGAKPGTVRWQAAHFFAPVPYKPNFNFSFLEKPANGAKPTIKEYLTGAHKKFDRIKFRYGWESEKPTTIAMWTIGSTVLIGGIWPSVLSLIVGAGLGGSREPKEKEFSLGGYRPSKPEAAEAVAPVVSQAERDRLDEMNRRLEEQLKTAGVIHDGQPTEEDPDGPILAEGVRKLDGGPLEPVAAQPREGDDDEIEIKGEFYPVMIHHKKHHDEDGSDAKNG